MPEPFGSFGWICSHTPLPQCNLFFSQLFSEDNYLTTLFPQSSKFFANYTITDQTVRDDPPAMSARSDAGVGIGANCEIPHVGQRGSVGDVALVVISALSVLFSIFLIFHATKRRAAVGRTELRIFLFIFAVHSALQAVTMSSMLEQDTVAIAILSAIHVAVIVALFWVLLGNALIATQIVEDGTPSAIIPLIIVSILFFIPPLYISLDTALRWTNTFHLSGGDVGDLISIALFILTLIWPAVAVLAYLGIMLWIVLSILREGKPALLYLLAFGIFAASQIIFFLTSQPLCNASNGKINSAFLSSLLNTVAVGTLYLAWRSITEDNWGEELGMGMY